MQASSILSSPRHHTPNDFSKPSPPAEHSIVHVWSPWLVFGPPFIRVHVLASHLDPGSTPFAPLQPCYTPQPRFQPLVGISSSLFAFLALVRLYTLFGLCFGLPRSHLPLPLPIHVFSPPFTFAPSPSRFRPPLSHLYPLLRVFTPCPTSCIFTPPFLLAPLVCIYHYLT